MEIFQSYLVGEPERKITKAFVRRAGNFAKFVWLPDLRLAFVSAGTETLEKLFIFRVLVVTFPLRWIKKDDFTFHVFEWFFRLLGGSSSSSTLCAKVRYVRLNMNKIHHRFVPNKLNWSVLLDPCCHSAFCCSCCVSRNATVVVHLLLVLFETTVFQAHVPRGCYCYV